MAESVDEITTLLSQSRIDPSTFESEAERLIRCHLPVELTFARTNELLTPDHTCFDAARQFCDRWSIPRQALENFIGLACGNPRFPMIMLQNPANSHERLSLKEMILLCPTLKWLEDVLEEIGLKMANVIILDVCPLLSSERLEEMEADDKRTAIEEAYDVTVEILARIKPKIMISCQCQTRGSDKWPMASNLVALELCSSVSGARDGLVRTVAVERHDIQVIQGFHPMYHIRQYDDSERTRRERLLKELLQLVYTPCATWQREDELLICVQDILNICLSMMKYFEETTKRFHETVKSWEEVMQNGISPQISCKRSLPTLENADSSFSAFDDKHRTFKMKLERMSTSERSICAARLKCHWPPAEAFVSMRPSD
ncbi:hypothetical protein MMC08_005942 [Hypocenomyce scalaris]|nr:hypothetical protein [Hypocenomyce scalaris]